jgi:hypothetical protein
LGKSHLNILTHWKTFAVLWKLCANKHRFLGYNFYFLFGLISVDLFLIENQNVFPTFFCILEIKSVLMYEPYLVGFK